MFIQIKAWAKKLKKQIFILYLAYKDDRVVWYVKLFTACVVAYAFSPIDLIPDFIPILGYLDDIIIVPLGIMFALKMLPRNVIDDCTEKADELMKVGKPKNWVVGSLIILVWLLIFIWVSIKLYKLIN
ncbi:YkvA family protein [Bacillus sp. CGMCC 1.16607]|uniref:YkvA family protein n=1 Tax=Bacillus sp. CGMCC 1.16607 TaxID=3351842 RepID=UPI003644BD95